MKKTVTIKTPSGMPVRARLCREARYTNKVWEIAWSNWSCHVCDVVEARRLLQLMIQGKDPWISGAAF